MIQTSALSPRPTEYALGQDFQQQSAIEVRTDIFGKIKGRQVKQVYLVSFGQPPAFAPTPAPPSIEQHARHEQHKQYLQRVSTEGNPPPITRATARKSWDLWQAIRKAAGPSLPIPSAGTGPQGVMFYSWDKGDHHLETEIFPDRDTEFFYRNRQTGELWGEDYSGGALPAGLLEKFSLFV